MEPTTDFQAAKAEAERTGGIVNGTIRKDKTPVYWVSAAVVDDTQVRDEAFAQRHGRPIGQYEKELLAAAERLKADAEA